MASTYDKSGIYQITNMINGKIYIGSAANLRTRKNGHVSALQLKLHSNSHLQKAWNKYGQDNFIFNTLLYCDKKNLLFYEQLFLDKFCSYQPNIGYNICSIAGSALGVKHTKQSRENMSKSHLGIKMPPFTEQHKKNMSIAIKKAKEKYIRKIYAYNKNTKELVKIYNNYLELEKDGFNIGSVSKVCLGKQGRKQHRGFIWSYKELF